MLTKQKSIIQVDDSEQFTKHLNTIVTSLPEIKYPAKSALHKSSFSKTVIQSIQIVKDALVKQNLAGKSKYKKQFDAAISKLDNTQLFNLTYLVLNYYSEFIPDKSLLRDSNYLVSQLYIKCCERFQFPDPDAKKAFAPEIDQLHWLIYQTMPADGTDPDQAIINAIATTLSIKDTVLPYQANILKGISVIDATKEIEKKEYKQKEEPEHEMDFKLFTKALGSQKILAFDQLRKSKTRKFTQLIIEQHILALQAEHDRLSPHQSDYITGSQYTAACKFLEVLIYRLKLLKTKSLDNIGGACKNLIKDILLEYNFDLKIIANRINKQIFIDLTKNEKILQEIKSELSIESEILQHLTTVLAFIPDVEYHQQLLTEADFKESKDKIQAAFNALKVLQERPGYYPIYEAFLKRKIGQMDNSKAYNLIFYSINYCYLVYKPSTSIFRTPGGLIIKDFYRHVFEKLAFPVDLLKDENNDSVLPSRLNRLNLILLDCIKKAEVPVKDPETAVCNDICNAFVMAYNNLNPDKILSSAVAKPIFAASIKAGFTLPTPSPTTSPEESDLSDVSSVKSSSSPEEEELDRKDSPKSKSVILLKTVGDVRAALNTEMIALKELPGHKKNNLLFISHLFSEISATKLKEDEPLANHTNIFFDCIKSIIRNENGIYHFNPTIENPAEFLKKLNDSCKDLLNTILNTRLDELLKELQPRRILGLS